MCDTSDAGVKGAVQGIASLVGFGSFVHPVDTSKLQDAQKQLTEVKQYWDAKIQTWKETVSQDRLKVITTWVNEAIDQQNTINEVLEGAIETNTLLIYMLFGLVVMLIIFDLSLPAHSVSS